MLLRLINCRFIIIIIIIILCRRALRSAGTNLTGWSRLQLDCPVFTVGSWAFPVAAAHIWNSLPEHIVSAPTLQSFRRHLKTFYKRFYYNNLSAYSTLVDLVAALVT